MTRQAKGGHAPPPHPQRGTHAARTTAVLAMLLAGVLAATTAPARAAGPPAAGPFGLIPSPTPAGWPRPYFSLTIAPGHSQTDTAIASNQGTGTERLEVTVSDGVTALNSGSAFQPAAGRCAGASCWVTGLPRSVTLAGGTSMALPFLVQVPASARPGQYLAGITAEPAVRPDATQVAANGRASARVVIIDQVTVAITITVGPMTRMRTSMQISPVSAGWVGSTPRLYIPVRNTGQTFVRGTGAISCQGKGGPGSWRVTMSTVLPDGSAVLPVNAPGLSSGNAACQLQLRGQPGTTFTWTGTVGIPAHAGDNMARTASGVYTSMPGNTMPPWAIMLMIIGALVLAALLMLLLQNRRHP
jgi:hypothetical protein